MDITPTPCEIQIQSRPFFFSINSYYWEFFIEHFLSIFFSIIIIIIIQLFSYGDSNNWIHRNKNCSTRSLDSKFAKLKQEQTLNERKYSCSSSHPEYPELQRIHQRIPAENPLEISKTLDTIRCSLRLPTRHETDFGRSFVRSFIYLLHTGLERDHRDQDEGLRRSANNVGRRGGGRGWVVIEGSIC